MYGEYDFSTYIRDMNLNKFIFYIGGISMVTVHSSEKRELLGLSTDEKPTGVSENMLFLELDTGDFYYFDGEEWQKVGGE